MEIAIAFGPDRSLIRLGGSGVTREPPPVKAALRELAAPESGAISQGSNHPKPHIQTGCLVNWMRRREPA